MIPPPVVHFETLPLLCGLTYRVLQEGRGGRHVIGWVRRGPENHGFVFRPINPARGWGDPGAVGASREEAVRHWMKRTPARVRSNN